MGFFLLVHGVGMGAGDGEVETPVSVFSIVVASSNKVIAFGREN